MTIMRSQIFWKNMDTKKASKWTLFIWTENGISDRFIFWCRFSISISIFFLHLPFPPHYSNVWEVVKERREFAKLHSHLSEKKFNALFFRILFLLASSRSSLRLIQGIKLQILDGKKGYATQLIWWWNEWMLSPTPVTLANDTIQIPVKFRPSFHLHLVTSSQPKSFFLLLLAQSSLVSALSAQGEKDGIQIGRKQTQNCRVIKVTQFTA